MVLALRVHFTVQLFLVWLSLASIASPLILTVSENSGRFPVPRSIGLTILGSGLSKYDGAEQSTKIIAEDVIALTSALSLSPKTTIVVGHSMGAIIACELASKYPFAGVTLIGPVHPAPNLAEVFTLRIKEVQACKNHTPFPTRRAHH